MLILGMCGASYELILVYTLAKGEGRGGGGAGEHCPPNLLHVH